MIFQISNQGRKSPEPQTKTYPVFQEAGLKVVFYLLQNAENVNNPYREIKEQTNVSLGSVKTSWMNLRDVALYSTLKMVVP